MLLFIKVRCLINVNKMGGHLRNGSNTTKSVIHGRPSLTASFMYRKVTIKISIPAP